MKRGYFPVLHGGTEERPDEIDTVQTARAVASSLRRLGFESEEIRVGLDLTPLAALAAKKPAAVFNLVEALEGRMDLGPLAAVALERFGLRISGAPAASLLLTESKTRMKELLLENDIDTPRWWRSGEPAPDDEMVIVKPVMEHGSLGIDAGSVVRGDRAAAQIAEREARFGCAFFAECFVDGREFQVSLLEDGRERVDVLPVQETLFEAFADDRPRIVDYAAKWDPSDPAYSGTPRRFGLETREPDLAAQLAELGWEVWEQFGIAGYARLDVRLSASGAAYVIDVNTNPCLADDAGFMAAAKVAALSFDDVIERIAQAALDDGDEPF